MDFDVVVKFILVSNCIQKKQTFTSTLIPTTSIVKIQEKKNKIFTEPFDTLILGLDEAAKLSIFNSERFPTEPKGTCLFNFQDVNINEEMIRKQFAYRDVSCTADEQELGKNRSI